jgi:hypothetical protein
VVDLVLLLLRGSGLPSEGVGTPGIQRLDRHNTGVEVVFRRDGRYAVHRAEQVVEERLFDSLIFSTLGVFTNACPGFIPEDRPQSKA